MLDILFAFGLGFYCVYTLCYTVKNIDEAMNNAAKAGIPFYVAIIGFVVLQDYVLFAIENNLNVIILGSVIGAILCLYLEGTFHWIWRRVHPASAPTDMIGAGQRGHIPKAPPKMSAALMGTSTAAFAVQGLDVKTTALIKLSMFAFKRDRYTIATLESALKLGDGRRYYAYQKLVADAAHEKSLKDIVHPYWRAINGNHSSARLMFTNLCQLARDTRNTNKRAIDRLVKIGQSLGLSPEDMGRAIGNVRA